MCVHALFFSLQSLYQVGTFSKATHTYIHQVKVKGIAITIVEANSLAKISWLLWCVHLHDVFFPTIPQNRYNKLFPNTHFYIITLHPRFCGNIRDHFYAPVFLFEIDHDDGTITGIVNHLLARYEPYINRHLIYRHRDN